MAQTTKQRNAPCPTGRSSTRAPDAMVRENAKGTKRVKGIPGYQAYAGFAKRRGAGKGIASLTGTHGTTARPGLRTAASARERGRIARKRARRR